MRNIILIVLASQFFSCCYKCSNGKMVEKMVIKHKTEWGVSGIDYKWKDRDYYGQSLYDCVIKLDFKRMKRANTYVINFKNGKNVLVEIMEFDDLGFAKTVYEKTLLAVEKIRTTRRKDAWQLCQPLMYWDLQYVHINKEKLYLIGWDLGSVVLKTVMYLLKAMKLFYMKQKKYTSILIII